MKVCESMRDKCVQQAVILAGGRGTRLQPLTLTRPKPMIEFHGRPFLAYLVEQLRDQGIERILLLLGYLPEVIQDYFGDGRKFGVRIECAVTPADDLTGTRLRSAKALIDERFLLCYCDNYTPLRLDRMCDAYHSAGAAAMITVYRNADGFTRSNVALDENNLVLRYDRERKSAGLQGVDIGYALLHSTVLDLIPERDVLFEEHVYPALAAKGELAAYVTDHRYYSVGSHERLPLTNEFLSNRPTIILDRDGVLNRKPPKAQYVRTWDEFHWMPGAKDALRLLNESGYRTIVVSNQAGVARGAMTAADVESIHHRMRAEVSEAGGSIDAIFYCPHHWDDGCECRKPRPGMLYQAQRQFHFDLTRSLFIGDDERDGQAAEAAGCPFVLAREADSLHQTVRELLHQNAEAISV